MLEYYHPRDGVWWGGNIAYHEILELDEGTRCRHNSDPCIIRCTFEKLPCKRSSSFVAVLCTLFSYPLTASFPGKMSESYPELTRIPVLRKRIHAQLPLKLILRLHLQILKLLQPGIALAVEFLQCVESTSRELSFKIIRVCGICPLRTPHVHYSRDLLVGVEVGNGNRWHIGGLF
jgi:hypothetical protein